MTPIVLPIGALVLISIAAFGVIWTRRTFSSSAAARSGRLTIESQPTGAEITIDKAPRGVTPLTMSLEPGTHTIMVRRDADVRTVPLQLTAGAQVQQYFDFTSAAAPIVAGKISVVTDPPKAQIRVDGRTRGASPLTIEDVSPGNHRVAAVGETGSAERTVTVPNGGTASVVFSLPGASTSAGAGWLTVSAPFESQIFEKNELVGTSGLSKIMMGAGRHELTLVNEALGFRERRTADVVAGKVTTAAVKAPTAGLSVNARPWADVSIDGKIVGQTPIANVIVAIGSHEIVFRHPQLGERRETIVVRIGGPHRIIADLTK